MCHRGTEHKDKIRKRLCSVAGSGLQPAVDFKSKNRLCFYISVILIDLKWFVKDEQIMFVLYLLLYSCY